MTSRKKPLRKRKRATEQASIPPTNRCRCGRWACICFQKMRRDDAPQPLQFVHLQYQEPGWSSPMLACGQRPGGSVSSIWPQEVTCRTCYTRWVHWQVTAAANYRC